MSQGLSGKWVEVAILLAAGVGFGVWQLRDAKRALERSRKERMEREARQARQARGHGDDDEPESRP